MDGPQHPLVLCVDDEPRVLDSLRVLLGRRYPVITAIGAQAALGLLAQHPNVAVIVSDMQMPGMNGVEFLERCCALVPEAQRIMLTGQADVATAMSAVNRGEVFRFLTKPCAAPQLFAAIAAAAARYATLQVEKSAIRQAGDIRRSDSDSTREAERPSSSDAGERALLDDLLGAILQDRLELHYQPVIDVEAGRVRGFEGLARWHHERIGHVPPTQFVAMAERNGEIARLGQWVLRRACLDSEQLSKGAAKLAVNVSAQELVSPHFLRHLEQCLSLPGLRPATLELELTESALAKDLDALRDQLTQVRSLGVSISVDDFGTGYSSLAYLSHLPVDVIKVDRVFVRDFDDGGKSIIKAALTIACDFGREVIIEGVETEEMLERVREIGATLVQGYLFARPMPVSELAAWLAEPRRLGKKS